MLVNKNQFSIKGGIGLFHEGKCHSGHDTKNAYLILQR